MSIHANLRSFPSPAKYSSARDQLTNQNVAVKKIMKPFSTPVLAKRTYRELKLLKHLRHENVCGFLMALPFFQLPAHCVSCDAYGAPAFYVSDRPDADDLLRLSLSATSSFLPLKICMFILFRILCLFRIHTANIALCSYFVTELLGTDLHRLLTSRPLEKQFIQYFLYQIMVCGHMCWHFTCLHTRFLRRNGS